MSLSRRRRKTRFGVPVVAVALLLGACAGAPEVPVGPDGRPDPVLLEGRQIYQVRCQSCHGSNGGGGRGPNIQSDQVVTAYPDPADQEAFVAAGKGQMPAYAERLTAAEIAAVVRYTREVLR
ncbi:MAG: cytochrome c [Acidimicrobiales bacterium]|nr:cytochrome c [Acidimicrobiales bacterium]